jgi:hypothetical protein
VSIEGHTTTSARRARQTLLETLEAGQPVMLQVDMGYLPYFDFGGEEYHFGGHAVVVCGYDADRDQVLVADRDEEVHPVPMADLEQARASTYKPFPPKNLWYTFDFRHKRPPAVDEVRQAILEMATAMLEPPIRNLGVKGIRKAAVEVARWPEKLDADELRFALFNTYIFIAPTGGTGGGFFRYMLSRFLHEAAGQAGEPRLAESAAEFRQVGNRWEALGDRFRQASEAPEPAAVVAEATAPLQALADEEEAAWRRLREVVQAD